MILYANINVLNHLESDTFSSYKHFYTNNKNDDLTREYRIDIQKFSVEDLIELSGAFRKEGFDKQARTIDTIIESNRGQKDIVVRGLEAFPVLLKNFLNENVINRWLFKYKNGEVYPYLVSSIEFKETDGYAAKKDQDKFQVVMYLLSYTRVDNAIVENVEKVSFFRQQVANKKISKILSNCDLYKETHEMIDKYNQDFKRYEEIMLPSFGKQFVARGEVLDTNHYNKNVKINARVINDLSVDNYKVGDKKVEIDVGENDLKTFSCPIHPLVRIFDLNSHNFYWMHSNSLELYVYKNMLHNLVLPESHHDLLDMLTDNLDDFSNDFVEGKTSGNLIICKGPPGVGKTLTAELYSESKEVPLIVLKAGKLGTKAAEVANSLNLYFTLAQHWNCPILINEVDIYISKRDNNIDLNAIVAEMLQLVEYYPGLLFVTTNRPDDIDDAFISRALAIISYLPPKDQLVYDSWKQIAALNNIELSNTLIGQLAEAFPTIVQRDMKMLLKLVLKRMQRTGETLDINLFSKMAIFRNIETKS